LSDLFLQTKNPSSTQKTVNPAQWLGYFVLLSVSVFTPRPVKADLTHSNPRLIPETHPATSKAIAADVEPIELPAANTVDRGAPLLAQKGGDRLKQQTLSAAQTMKRAPGAAVSVTEFKAPLTQAQQLLEAAKPEPSAAVTLSETRVSFAEPAKPDEFLSLPQTPDPDLGIIQIEEDTAPATSPPDIPQPSDPDLGIMQIEEEPRFDPGLPQDPNNPQLPIYPPFIIQPNQTDQCPDPDPDLGCFKIEFPPPPRPKRVFLSAGVSYTQRTNVLAGIDPVNDGLFQTGLVLYGAPPIGSRTFLEFTAAANIIRYSQEVDFDYNDLFFSLGILQRLSPTMYLGLGWSNQQLFQANDNLANFDRPKGQRFLNDHAVRAELRRQDKLANRLFWNTYYRFQWTFSDPDDRTRAINLLAAGLTYDIQSNLQLGLDYTFVVTNYTNIDRDDLYNQITARLSYIMFRNTRLAFFAGYSFGSSTDPTIDFDGFVFGVGLNVQIGLF